MVVGHDAAATGSTNARFWIRRYDRAGVERWARSFEGGDGAEARGLTLDRLGNAIAVGLAGGRSWARKYDRDGSEVFASFGVSGSRAEAVATDGSGNVYLATAGLAVTKYDGQGALQGTFGADATGPRTTFPASIAVDGEGAILVAGTVLTSDGGIGSETSPEDIWVRRYDAQGVPLWTRTFDGGRADRALAVAVNAANEVFVTGSTFGELAEPQGPRFGWRRWLRKYAPSGSELWTVTQDAGGTLPVSLPDGGVLLVGWLEVQAFGADGAPAPRRACSAEAIVRTRNVAAGAIAFDPAGFVLLVGRIPESNDAGGFTNPFDAWIGKYAAP